MIKNILKWKCGRCDNLSLRIVEIGSCELIECRKCKTLFSFNGKSVDRLVRRDYEEQKF